MFYAQTSVLILSWMDKAEKSEGKGMNDNGYMVLFYTCEKGCYRLTQAGILRALSFPGFFLSTFRGSRVTQPAAIC
jgi:hypothetical protein